VPALVEALSVSDTAVRAAAARALGEIRDVGAAEALIRASRDPDAAVRDAALDALDGMRSVVAALGAAALSVEGRDRRLPPPSERDANSAGRVRRAETPRTLMKRLFGW
jgi:HEAT repeat protein